MKRFVLAIGLTCVFSVSALAGEMPTMGIVVQPSKPAVAPAPGEMPTTGAASIAAPEEMQGPELLTTIVLAIINWSR